MQDLLDQQCKNYSEDTKKLTNSEIQILLEQLADWKLDQASQTISKQFKFKNYLETIAFTNAVAWVANQQNHHPEITVNYNTCDICYTTHSINHLSINDFICAAKINNLDI